MSTISLCQGRWNSKDGSQTTNNVVTRDSRRPRCRNSSRTCTGWYLIKIKRKKIGIKKGLNKAHGRPTPSSVCVSGMKPICQRRSGCWTISKKELKKQLHELHGQEISSRLEISPKRKSLGRAHALFNKGLQEVGGDESKIHVVHGEIRISFFLGSAMDAKYTLEGEGHAGEGWNIKPDVIAGICTEFSEALFEAVVNSSSRKSRIFDSLLIARLTSGS